MAKQEFSEKARRLLEQQLDLYVAKSDAGHFLAEDEIANVKIIVEAFGKSKGMDLEDPKDVKAKKLAERISTKMKNDQLRDLVAYGDDEET